MNADPVRSGTPRLVLDNVTRTYGEPPTQVQALSAVSLSVEVGEFVAVMGPSGSGKSTLLALAGGLDVPTTGRVVVDGVDLAPLSNGQRADHRLHHIGYVFQDFNLLPGLTAVENVSMPLELAGHRRRDAEQQAAVLLDEIGLGSRLTHMPSQLSGGEQQRVAIARALAPGARLILADEPTGALDSVTGEAVMQTLRRGCHNGSSVVVVTHDAQLAAWADRIVFLRDGRLIDETDRPGGLNPVASGAAR